MGFSKGERQLADEIYQHHMLYPGRTIIQYSKWVWRHCGEGGGGDSVMCTYVIGHINDFIVSQRQPKQRNHRHFTQDLTNALIPPVTRWTN